MNTGLWGATLAPLSNTLNVRPGQTPFVGAPMQAAIVSGDGRALGVTMTGELATDGSWKGSPVEWETISAQAYASLAVQIGDVADRVLPRAVVNFRSPRSQANAFSGFGGAEEEATEWSGDAIVFEANRALVLAKFSPRTTARMERIRLHIPGTEPVEATFVGTLEDWGGFVVEFEGGAETVAGAIAEPITTYRNRLLVTAEVTVQGTSRVQYIGREWLRNFRRVWRGTVYPSHWSVGGYSGLESKRFMFGLDGQLVAFPIERREKVSVEDWGESRVLAPANYVLDAARGGAFDADNRPLSEREESRVAWLGVELQRLDQELARLYGVSELSQDGTIGAVVTYIYPNSPATEMDLRQGDIILRVHAEDQPRPLDVVVEEDYSSFMDQYWAEIENIPAQVFDQIPTPWPNVDNVFNQMLTGLGFGSSASLEIYRDGALLSESFTVTQGPDHYNAAGRFSSESLGMDVRDMTYEVRRYLQLTDADTGVIVSKLEPGEKAAVAGLKPYELIIAVNDEPVTSVERFEELIEGQSELRFSVKRRDKGRVVKIRMD